MLLVSFGAPPSLLSHDTTVSRGPSVVLDAECSLFLYFSSLQAMRRISVVRKLLTLRHISVAADVVSRSLFLAITQDLLHSFTSIPGTSLQGTFLLLVPVHPFSVANDLLC